MQTTSMQKVSVCRACSAECTDFKSIYKQGIILGDVTTLATLLNYCTDVEINPEEDVFPEQICMSCVSHVARYYAFKKMVLETDEQFRKQHFETTTRQSQEGVQEQTVTVVELLETDATDEHEPYGNDNDDEELRELAVAAQIKQTLEARLSKETAEQQQSNDKQILVTGPDDFKPVHESTADNIKVENIQENEIRIEDGDTYEIVVPDQYIVHKIEREDSSSKRKKMRLRKRGPAQANKPVNPDWKCRECGKQLSNQHSFKYHMQLHSDDTPFVCNLCGEGFKTRNAYDGHLSTHDANNPNVCRICGKTYRQSSSLRTHMLNHTGEKPFQCEICGKGMTQKSGFKKHMLVHTDEKPHSCDICGRDFRYSSNLIAHKRSHTGDKPFVCRFCTKCFPTSEQLKRHSIVHVSERPFSCAVCSKSFKRRSSLLQHRHTHDNDDAQSEDDNIVINEKILRSKVIEMM